MNRSYLFAPGHNEKLLARVFDAGADAVMLDLEDAVPEHAKDTARDMVADVLTRRRAWVRINATGSAWCQADLDAVGEHAMGIRIPKTESPEDVEWVSRRAPGKPLICAIESARGVLAAPEIAAGPDVSHLAMGGVDLRRDLNAGDGDMATLYVRSHLVLASRAAGIGPPIDSVYPHLANEPGLQAEARFARSLGFFGKSAIHPCQLAMIHQAFTPSQAEVEWARDVLAAFDSVGGGAARLSSGEFIDLPVAERARRVLVNASDRADPSALPAPG